MTASLHGRVAIDELRRLPEFTLLTENQQKFLATYTMNGYDAKAAVFASYPRVKTEESARVMGVRILQSPGMVMLLSLHFGDDPKDAFCKMVAKMVLRGKISREQLAAIKLLADVREFRRPWAPQYERKIADGLANNRPAVKKRVQRAAVSQAVNKAAESQPVASLMPDFEKI